MKLLLERWKKYLNEESQQCIPLDEWDLQRIKGFMLYSHAAGFRPSYFNEVIKDGFRVQKRTDALAATFFQEANNDKIKERLRKRAKESEKRSGNSILLMGALPNLVSGEDSVGIEDERLEDIKTKGVHNTIVGQPIRNVLVFEEFPVGHQWHGKSWKIPGRFLIGIYDNENDTICLNSSFEGGPGTEHGKRLSDNWKEYLKMSKEPAPTESPSDTRSNAPEIDYVSDEEVEEWL